MQTKVLQIYLDGELEYTYDVQPEGYIQHIEIDVRGIKQLRLYSPRLNSYYNTTTSLGLANMQAVK